MRGGRVKAGESIQSLSVEEIDTVLVHPSQQALLSRLAELIEWLKSCESPDDYYDFQWHLVGELYKVEERRGLCTRVVKTLRRGKGLPADSPTLPAGFDPTRLETWELEVFMCERLARQLRTVGDGLAWRYFNYNRRIILALSRNQSPGPMYPKDGLPSELDRVEACWKDSHHFALLHDHTNCLRIADISEFDGQGGVLLHEVKTSDRVEPYRL
jgi:hypothetical protein